MARETINATDVIRTTALTKMNNMFTELYDDLASTNLTRYDDTTKAFTGTGDTSFAGNVGIKNTTPEEALHINGNILLGAGGIYKGYDTSATIRNVMRIGVSDFFVAGDKLKVNYTTGDATFTNDLSVTGNLGVGIASPTSLLHTYSATDNVCKIEAVNTSILDLARASSKTRFAYDTGNNFTIEVNGAERMRIQSDGKIGIGTTSPSEALDVVGNIAVSGTNTISTIADDTLPALGALGGKHRLLQGFSTYGTLFGVLGSGKGYIQQQRVDGTATAYDLLLQPNGGNVGIGTTSPGSKLDVNGNVNIDGTGVLNSGLKATGGGTIFSLGTTDASPVKLNFSLLNSATASEQGFFIDATEPGVSDNRSLVFQRYGGNTGFGVATPYSKVEFGFSTENLGFDDAGSTSASEQDWIEVSVGGNTGYIRVYATK